MSMHAMPHSTRGIGEYARRSQRRQRRIRRELRRTRVRRALVALAIVTALGGATAVLIVLLSG